VNSGLPSKTLGGIFDRHKAFRILLSNGEITENLMQVLMKRSPPLRAPAMFLPFCLTPKGVLLPVPFEVQGFPGYMS